MGIQHACDCYLCTKGGTMSLNVPVANEGKHGEHMCGGCMSRPACRDHPATNPSEDTGADDSFVAVLS